MSAERFRHVAAPAVVVVAIAALAGCGSWSSGAHPETRRAQAVRRYLAQVEPIRLGVNRLLDHADPILRRYGRRQLSARQAQRRMNALEHRFAGYEQRIVRLRRVPAELSKAQRAYAHTYVLEDAYLRALTTAIPTRSFDDLPHTQSGQRAAIIAWRARLEAVANRLDLRLPPYVQIAGRGEIAPSPPGS